MPVNAEMFIGMHQALADGLSPDAILGRITQSHPDISQGVEQAKKDNLSSVQILQRIYKRSQDMHREEAIKRGLLGLPMNERMKETGAQFMQNRQATERKVGTFEAIRQYAGEPYGIPVDPEVQQQKPHLRKYGAAAGFAPFVAPLAALAPPVAAAIASGPVIASGAVADVAFSGVSGGLTLAEQPFIQKKIGVGFTPTGEAVPTKPESTLQAANESKIPFLVGAGISMGLSTGVFLLARSAQAKAMAQAAREDRQNFMNDLNSKVSQPALPAPGETSQGQPFYRQPTATPAPTEMPRVYAAPSIDSPIGKNILKIKSKLADLRTLQSAQAENPSGEYIPNKPESTWTSDNPHIPGVTRHSYDTSAERIRGAQDQGKPFDAKLQDDITRLSDMLDRHETQAWHDTVNRWMNVRKPPPPTDLRKINGLIVEKIKNPGADLAIDHEVNGATQADRTTPQARLIIPETPITRIVPMIGAFRDTLQSSVDSIHAAVDPSNDLGGYSPETFGRLLNGQRNIAKGIVTNFINFGKQMDKAGSKHLFDDAVKVLWLGDKAGPVSEESRAIASMTRQALDHAYNVAKSHGVEFDFMENYLSQIVRTSKAGEPFKDQAIKTFVKNAANVSTSAEYHAKFQNGFELQKWLNSVYGAGKFQVVTDLPSILANYHYGITNAIGARDFEYALSQLEDGSTGLKQLYGSEEFEGLKNDLKSKAAQVGGYEKLPTQESQRFHDIHKYENYGIRTANGGQRNVSVSPKVASLFRGFLAKNIGTQENKLIQGVINLNSFYKGTVLNFSPFHAINLIKAILLSKMNPMWPGWANMVMDTVGLPIKVTANLAKLGKAVDLLKDESFVQDLRLKGGVGEFGLGQAMDDLQRRMDATAFGKTDAWKGIRESWNATQKITFNKLGRLAQAAMYADDLKFVNKYAAAAAKKMGRAPLTNLEIHQTAGALSDAKLGSMNKEMTNFWADRLGAMFGFAHRWLYSNAFMPMGALAKIPGMEAPMRAASKALGSSLPGNPVAYHLFAKNQADFLTSGLMSIATLAAGWTYHNTGKFPWQLVDVSDPQYFTKILSVHQTDGTYWNFMQMYGDPVGMADGVKDVVTDLDTRKLDSWFVGKLGFAYRGPKAIADAARGESFPGQKTVADKAEAAVEFVSHFIAPIVVKDLPQGFRTGDFSKAGQDIGEIFGVKKGKP